MIPVLFEGSLTSVLSVTVCFFSHFLKACRSAVFEMNKLASTVPQCFPLAAAL